MKKIILTSSIILICFVSFAQNKFEKEQNDITKEGKLLYRSEMASWYGTDIFMEKYNNNPPDSIGYFSFTDANNLSTCVFYSKKGIGSIIFTVVFDSTYAKDKANINFDKRNFTTEEMSLYLIRENSLSEIKRDTFFKKYKHTDLNLIPVIENHEKKVYVLTGPQDNGIVIFGNDYLLTFDKDNMVKTRKRLHKNIIICEMSDSSIGAIHSHLPETGDFITPTDVCTIMLYEKFTHWKTYTVVSANYISMWDCLKNRLLILRKDVFDKINKDADRRNQIRDSLDNNIKK